MTILIQTILYMDETLGVYYHNEFTFQGSEFPVNNFSVAIKIEEITDN